MILKKNVKPKKAFSKKKESRIRYIGSPFLLNKDKNR